MNLRITRVAFCEACAKAKRPQVGDYFVTLGKGKTVFRIHRNEDGVHSRDYGFVPHLFELKKAMDNKVHATKVCLMNGCGAIIKPKEDGINFSVFVYDKQVKGVIMSIADWNTLILSFKRDSGYNLD